MTSALQKPTFEILSGAEIWAERPEVEYVVAGFLQRGKLGMICAYGSSLKTWMLVALAIAVACGGKWLGRFECQQRRVLYIDYESDWDELIRRVRGLCASPIEGLDLAVMPDVFLTSGNFAKVMIQLAEIYGFIAIDSLSGGSQDISDNDPRFAQPLRILKRVAAKTGCVIVILHHNRKTRTDKEGEAIEESDLRQTPRGTGGIYAAVDVMLSAASLSDSESLVAQTKSRGGQTPKPFVVKISGVAPAPVTLTATTQSERQAIAARALEKVTEGRFLSVLRKNPDGMSQNKLVDAVGGKKSIRTAQAKDLAARGVIDHAEGLYRVPAGVRSESPTRDPDVAGDSVRDPANGIASIEVGPAIGTRSNTSKQGVS